MGVSLFQLLFENPYPKITMNSLHLHLLLFLFLFFAFVSPQTVLGNAELRALMDLKSSMDPEGKILSSWISDGDPCGGLFEGIACNEHRKVANISLQGKGLSGWLSPAVAELRCLTGLYLHYNNLSGEIPPHISNLTDLVDLYLDVNSLSGTIPTEVGNMVSLQVLQLGDNQLVGNIPTQMGSLKQLSTLALQYNKLSGQIPLGLGNLEKLSRLNLSFNNFSGAIPATLAHVAHLEVLDIQNNSLSGIVPSALKRLGEGFQGANNPGLCGDGFSTLGACNKDQDLNVNHIDASGQDQAKNSNPTKTLPEPAHIKLHCNQTHCSKSRRFSQTVFTASAIAIILTIIGAGIYTFVRYRRQKQRIASNSSEGKLSPEQPKEFYKKSPSALVNLEYCNGWYPMPDGLDAGGVSNEYLNQYRFNVDEVESATQYLSEANLLSKSKFSAVYKGVMRDGSLVAVRSINVTCCKTEEAEFVKGLSVVTSLRHENLVRLRGFCCSRDRGECFLIYDFATMGNLSQYLDIEDGNGSGHLLDWSQRVSIIKGIAKGIGYLHSNEASKPTIVHQNISVENVHLDHQFTPLIMDAGLPKLLADDVVFSALKVSAAMGYLAPEYITTGRFTEKSDIYAFGVIVLQVLSGKTAIGGSIRIAFESLRFDDSIDTNLRGRYSKSEAAALSKLAVQCIHEAPDQRPTMVDVIQELSVLPSHS